MTDYQRDQHLALMAVQSALTDSEQKTIKFASKMMYPKLDGAEVADILDILEEHDSHLFWTEELFSENMILVNQMNLNGTNPHLWGAAMQACIMKGPLFEEVLRLVLKAEEVLRQDRGDGGESSDAG